MSRIFMPRSMVPLFHVSYFHATQYGAAFSFLAFSASPFGLLTVTARCHNWIDLQNTKPRSDRKNDIETNCK